MKQIFYHNFSFQVNGYEGGFKVPILCPNVSKGCKSYNIKKDGHDTSVKSAPQKYTCKDCGITFYSHTSAFYRKIEPEINNFLLNLFDNGRINSETIKKTLECSNSSVSKILERIMNAINQSITVKMAWDTPISGEIIFIDETWIKINKKDWYLIIVVNEDRHVLSWRLVEKRIASVVASIVHDAILRLPVPPHIIVSDDFSTYKRVVKKLNYNLIHVRHIHKPPYGRMVVDIIEHKLKKIITTHIATTNDIFCSDNTFLTQISYSEEVIHEKGKRGRKKGGKNSNKAKSTSKNSQPKKKAEERS